MIQDPVTGQTVPFSFGFDAPAEKVSFGRVQSQFVPDQGESGEINPTAQRVMSLGMGVAALLYGVPKALDEITKFSKLKAPEDYDIDGEKNIDRIKRNSGKAANEALNLILNPVSQEFDPVDLQDPAKRLSAINKFKAEKRYSAEVMFNLKKAEIEERLRLEPFKSGEGDSLGRKAFEAARRVETFNAGGDFLSSIFRIFAKAAGAGNILSYYSESARQATTVFNISASQVGSDARGAWRTFLESDIFNASLPGEATDTIQARKARLSQALDQADYLVVKGGNLYKGRAVIRDRKKVIEAIDDQLLIQDVNLITGTGKEKIGILTEIDSSFGDRLGPTRKIRGELVGAAEGFLFLPSNIQGPFTDPRLNQALFLAKGWMSSSLQRTAGLMEELASEGKNFLKDTVGYLASNKNTGKVSSIARAFGILPDFHLKTSAGMLGTYMGFAMKTYAGLAVANQSQFWQQNGGFLGWMAGGALNTGIGAYIGSKLSTALKLDSGKGRAIGALVGATSLIPGSPFNDGVIGGAARVFGGLNRVRSAIGEVTLMNTWRRTLDKIAPGSTDFTSAMFFGLAGSLALTTGYRKFSGKTFISKSDRIDYLKAFNFDKIEDIIDPMAGGPSAESRRTKTRNELLGEKPGNFVAKDLDRTLPFQNMEAGKKEKIFNEIKTYVEEARQDPARWAKLQNNFAMVEDTYSAKAISLAEMLEEQAYEKARGRLQNPNLGLAKRIETMALELPLARGVIYGAIAMTGIYFGLTGQLGTIETPNEIGQYNRGEKLEVVRRAQNWEGGSEAYEGAEPLYHRPTFIARLVSGSMSSGSSNRGMVEEFLLKNFTYELERESYYDKPAPITSAAFDTLPMVYLAMKPLADLIKRPKLMHEEMWHQDGQYLEISEGLDPLPNMAMGGEGMAAPVSPYSYSRVISKAVNQAQAFAGIRGFYSKEATKLIGGFTGIADQRKELESYTENVDMTSRFYDLHSGGGFMGVPFVSEIIRRFMVRNNTDTYNPILNDLPSWLPESMRYGNPYTSLAHGGAEYRMPGEGYAALNPEMKGVDPEDYSTAHKFKILGNIAPWSNQYRDTRDQMESEISRGIISKEGYRDYYNTLQDIKDRQKKLAFNPYLYDPTNYDSVIGRVKSLDPENLAFELEGVTGKFTLAGVTNNAGDLVGQLNLEIHEAAKVRKQNASEFQKLVEEGEFVKVTMPKSVGHAVNERGHIMAAVTKPLSQLSYNTALARNANVATEDSVVGQYAMGGFAGKTAGRAYQAFTHAATSLTAPAEFISKFGFSPGMKLMPERTAREEYEQFNLYGSRVRLWQNPLTHWFGSSAKSFAHNVVGLDFVSPGVQKQRDVEEYFDKAKYVKYKSAERAANAAGNDDMAIAYKSMAKDTMIGGSGFVGDTRFRNLMKGNEGAYALGMAAEINPYEQNKILSVLPEHKQRIMAGKYGQQDQAAINRMLQASPISEAGMDYLDKLNNMQRSDGFLMDASSGQAYNMQKQEGEEYSDFRRRKELEGYYQQNNKPKSDWGGFNPNVDLEDVKLRYLQNEGLDYHNFSIFESRNEYIHRKPYITSHDMNQVGIGYTNLNMAINTLNQVRQMMNAPVSGTTFVGNSESRSSNFIQVTLEQDRFYRMEGA